MATLCIGGVCIPYSAILPLLFLGLKWIATHLARLGFLPEGIVKQLGLQSVVDKDEKVIERTVTTSSSVISSKGVKEIGSIDEWNDLMNNSSSDTDDSLVVVKFTATWCKPCKEIAPLYSDLSTRYNANFIEVDVDELDEVASEHNVSMMPTFIIMEKKDNNKAIQVGTMSGSNKQNLESFISKHVPLYNVSRSTVSKRQRRPKRQE